MLFLLVNKIVRGRRQRLPTSRYYVFTIQNLTSPPWGNLPEGVQYLVCQHERGEKTGRDHLQGYLELTRSEDMRWCQNHICGEMSLQKRRGNQKQAIDYCTKTATRIDGPWHYGEPYKSLQGGRTDLHRMRDAIREGANYRQLIEEMPMTLARHHRFVSLCYTYTKPLKREVAVFLLYGRTRAGKSRWVNELYDPEDLYIIPLTQKSSWYDGYDGEENVLLDDFSGGLPRTQLLRLLDRYRLRVPNKGGFVWWRPIRIYITTNIHPRKWYKDWRDFEEHYDALSARIQAVYDFNLGATLEERLVDKDTFFESGRQLYHSSDEVDRRRSYGPYDIRSLYTPSLK